MSGVMKASTVIADGESLPGLVLARALIELADRFGGHLARDFTARVTTHAVSHNGQDAAVDAVVVEQGNLVLLVFTVAFVDARRSGKFVANGHGG